MADFLNLKPLYKVNDARDRVFGDLYRPEVEQFEYGVAVKVATIKAACEDGQSVVITETRCPARFFTAHVEGTPDRRYEFGAVTGKPAVVISTGSGDEPGRLLLQIAKAIAEGMLGIRLPKPTTAPPTTADEIRAVVSVACPVCDELTPVEEMNRELRTIACQNCARVFDVPVSAIHDAQHQCLMALGEA